MPLQDRADRAGRDPELGAEPVLTAAFSATKQYNSLLDLGRDTMWAVVRTRRPVDQAGLTFGAEPRDPPVSALTGDAELLGDMGNGPTVADDPLDEQTTTMQIQTSVSVGHEDLLGERMT
jgi:hypothetical protein